MKPLKLVMSAFGSYGGEEIIDFSKIKGGLFLVSGRSEERRVGKECLA